MQGTSWSDENLYLMLLLKYTKIKERFAIMKNLEYGGYALIRRSKRRRNVLYCSIR
jgi:hypothetical protein